MRKPEHQWETRQFRAVRSAKLPSGWAEDPRAEAFELRCADGGLGHACFSLRRQQVDALGAADPLIVFAARCWLAARGSRTTNLHGPAGPLDQQTFTVEMLADPEPRAPAQRLVTLAPSNVEVVEALGCIGRVLACEDSSDIVSCERLGPDLGPDLERVAQLAPDLVISSLSVPGMERVVTGLAVRRVPQLVLAPRTLADVRANLVAAGRYLGVEGAAQQAVADFDAQRDALVAARPATTRRVYLEWWPRPMFTPGRDCFSNELIELAGGINVFGDRDGASLEITAQQLVQADPEVCFVSWCGVDEAKLDPQNLITRSGLETLAAARNGAVFRLSEAFSGRPGPRVLEASRRMAAAIAKTNR